MKPRAIILATLLSVGGTAWSDDWVLFRADNPVFNVLDDYQYDFHEAKTTALLKRHGLGAADAASAKSLNTVGYRLYERKAFSEAADLFRLAVRADAAYYFPHWNLACVLAILSGQGRAVDPQEIVYHLQCSLLLDPATARKKLVSDADLDPVRAADWFREFMRLAERGEPAGNDEEVSLDGRRVAALAVEVMEPVRYGPIYRPAPDQATAAFMACWDGQPEVFLLSGDGLLVRVTEGGTASLSVTANGNIAWQPQGRGIAFVGQSRLRPGAAILYFDLRTLRLRDVFLVGEHQDERISEMNALRFASADTIRFMGGGSLEYSFSGREYEVKLDGGGFRAVPGGRVEHGEDWSGGD